MTEESYSSAVLEWSRPYIPGRHDLYYDVYISNSGKYVKFNSYPVVSDSARVRYTLTGLRPLTNYQVKVSVCNGVSENYESTEGGACELSWTTSNNSKSFIFSNKWVILIYFQQIQQCLKFSQSSDLKPIKYGLHQLG